MSRQLKLIILSVARLFGLFYVARRATKSKLRILCYHGISTGTAHLWRPMLFMQASTLRDRLDLLKRNNYPVLSLDNALSQLAEGTLPDNTVVLTFDDGWQQTYKQALPLLCEREMPGTVYVTTYYVEKETPVYTLVIQYLAWLARSKSQLDKAEIDRQEQVLLKQIGSQSLAEQRAACAGLALDLGLTCTENDYGEFRLMSSADVTRASEMPGIDIQLHTRRHRFPDNSELVEQELIENIADLRNMLDAPLRHFCYPSGEYYASQFPTLEKLGIASATTTDPGLNDTDTNVYELKRFVDSDNYSQLEFEAEVSGFAEFLRMAKRTVLRR